MYKSVIGLGTQATLGQHGGSQLNGGPKLSLKKSTKMTNLVHRSAARLCYNKHVARPISRNAMDVICKGISCYPVSFLTAENAVA